MPNQLFFNHFPTSLANTPVPNWNVALLDYAECLKQRYLRTRHLSQS